MPKDVTSKTVSGASAGDKHEATVSTSVGTARGSSVAHAATTFATGIIRNPLPDDHPFYANVGRVASEWAHAEHTLDLIIWKLASINPQRGACITAQIMGISGRCKAIVSLGELRGIQEPILRRVRKLMSDSYPVGDMRARIVHDPWYTGASPMSVGQFKSMAYSDRRFGIEDISQPEVDNILGHIKCLTKTARALFREIRDALEASAKTRS